MKKTYLVIFFLIISILSFAKKWDAIYINKLIAAKEYDKVITYYKSLYGDAKNPQYAMAFKIADMYVKKKDYTSAIYWYKKEEHLLRETKVNLLNLANTYKIMGEYQKALDIYLNYAAETGDANKVMNDVYVCERLIRANSFSENYMLEPYQYNTVANDYALSVLRNNITYFQDKLSDNKTFKSGIPSILKTERIFNKWNNPISLIQQEDKERIYTFISFSEDGNKVILSAKSRLMPIVTQKKGTTIQPIQNERIYFADFLGGKLFNIVPFPYNNDNYTLSQPCFNEDNTQIFFVSNMLGSVGGFDIFTSKFENGKWSKPANLGKLINSKAEEKNPFYTIENGKPTLYFSSKREGGFGEGDIYKSEFTDNLWQDVELLHAPINTPSDEESYVFDVDIQTAYVSSDRPNGRGGFDLYRIRPYKVGVIVNIIDSITNIPIDYAYLELYNYNSKIEDGVTNTDGRGELNISKNQNYTLNISKDEYRPKSISFNSFKKENGDSIVFNIKLIPDKNYSLDNSLTTVSPTNYILFNGNFTDISTNKIIKPKVQIINLNSNKVKTLEFDSNAEFNIKLMTNNNYKLIIDNDGMKIKDEITTYGLEHGSVKIKRYILTGTKFKTSENKVLSPVLVPDSLKTAYFGKSTIGSTTTTSIANYTNNSHNNTNNSNNNIDPEILKLVEQIKQNAPTNNNTSSTPHKINQIELDKKYPFLFDLLSDLNINDYKQMTPITTAESIDQSYYKIQIGTFINQNADMANIVSLGKIEITPTSNNRYIYRIGNYTDKLDAQEKLNILKSKGYSLAFILQYLNDNIVGIIK